MAEILTNAVPAWFPANSHLSPTSVYIISEIKIFTDWEPVLKNFGFV